MRTQAQLRHTRTRVRERYALMPLEGFPTSVIPPWLGTEARVLASPALGAAFVQILLDIAPGGGTHHRADRETETFFYVLSGAVGLTIGDEAAQTLESGGYAFVPASSDYRIEAASKSSILALRKRFEPASGLSAPPPIVGRASDVSTEVWMEIEGARLQTLIPDDPRYDMAMNIFTFEPGYSLPIVETHIMEHGLYFLQGKGLYYLGEEWMEVEADDYIWMGPYVPQSFYATGTEAARYLYYKNVNRDVAL